LRQTASTKDAKALSDFAAAAMLQLFGAAGKKLRIISMQVPFQQRSRRQVCGIPGGNMRPSLIVAAGTSILSENSNSAEAGIFAWPFPVTWNINSPI
jgi:hypothetical protein